MSKVNACSTVPGAAQVHLSWFRSHRPELHWLLALQPDPMGEVHFPPVQNELATQQSALVAQVPVAFEQTHLKLVQVPEPQSSGSPHTDPTAPLWVFAAHFFPPVLTGSQSPDWHSASTLQVAPVGDRHLPEVQVELATQQSVAVVQVVPEGLTQQVPSDPEPKLQPPPQQSEAAPHWAPWAWQLVGRQ